MEHLADSYERNSSLVDLSRDLSQNGLPPATTDVTGEADSTLRQRSAATR